MQRLKAIRTQHKQTRDSVGVFFVAVGPAMGEKEAAAGGQGLQNLILLFKIFYHTSII